MHHAYAHIDGLTDFGPASRVFVLSIVRTMNTGLVVEQFVKNMEFSCDCGLK